MEITWNDGLDSYKENKLVTDGNGIKTHYLTLKEHSTVDLDRPYLDIAYDILKNQNKIDILYSGGQDSELLLRTAIELGLNFNVVTMKIKIDNCLINTHDLYYSESFCRERDIKQQFVEIDVGDFFGNNRYLNYLEPYTVAEPHIATHLWLLEQCDNFPVFAGDYSWPWTHKSVLSPHRYRYCASRRFMNDRGIEGISNFLNHSLDLNMLMIKKHLELYHDSIELGLFKSKIYSSLGVGELTPRLINYGWESYNGKTFNKNLLRIELLGKFGDTKSVIIWEEQMKSLLNSSMYSNDQH
jgi:hypothetical protein